VVELGVPLELSEAHGAVSAVVAAAMADGVRRRFNVEVGIAVTGIAGPQGARPGKPVGLTWTAATRRGHPAQTDREVWPFDRDGNRRAATLQALELALAQVAGADR
jgi:PncC family amidohydrolase